MALYIARHGQTDWNAAGRYQARTDVPLNATGQEQAHGIARLFDNMGISFANACCSPLSRAVATAKIILADKSTPLLIDESLVEIDLGNWEGLYAHELIATYGDAYSTWRDEGYINPPHTGESMLDLIARVRPSVESLHEASLDKDVLVVAHQATNMGIKSALSGDASAEAFAMYRQGNHEVDVWDGLKREFGSRITIQTGGETTG